MQAKDFLHTEFLCSISFMYLEMTVTYKGITSLC